jgi:hypothetical protein
MEARHLSRELLATLLIASCAAGAGCRARQAGPAAGSSTGSSSLATTIAELSEPGGDFESDTLISDETAYLQVTDLLGKPPLLGGAYIGVGPEQNYTYIARLKPRWAFILDIRRQNTLQHLMLNAVFASAGDPLRFLCMLFARPCPGGAGAPAEAGLEATLAALDEVAPSEAEFERNLARILDHVENRLRFPLSGADRAEIRAMYRTLFEEQLEIGFRGRGPLAPGRPTLRALITSRSPSGQTGSFLASSADYGFVRELATSGHVVPVVGDFAGPQALRRIAAWLRQRGETVSAFYVSNVEFYLFRDAAFARFVANVRELPLTPDSVFIRACFDYGRPHPAQLSGHRSATVLQRIPRFLQLHDAGAYKTYWDVCAKDYLR